MTFAVTESRGQVSRSSSSESKVVGLSQWGELPVWGGGCGPLSSVWSVYWTRATRMMGRD